MAQIFFALLCLVGLSGCEFFAPKPPYAFSSKQISAEEFEVELAGRPGISEDQLKGFFQVKAKDICSDRVFLLRGMRVESHPQTDTHMLRAQIDCVGLDYFEEK